MIIFLIMKYEIFLGPSFRWDDGRIAERNISTSLDTTPARLTLIYRQASLVRSRQAALTAKWDGAEPGKTVSILYERG